MTEGVENPPSNFTGILKRLGPGLILAGSIVGSGELVATTRTGAEAGFTLLWLIIVGCVLKVFCQIEISRHCIVNRETTISALLRIPKFGKFVAWFWFITFLSGLGQLGGIVGGVGQALEITAPIFGEHSAKWWAAIVTAVTVVMLARGGFTFIEIFCTVLVGAFTIITVGNLFALQTKPEWAISGEELASGLTFSLPGVDGALLTALATFGIIGVGAAELVAYPYWCLEKGYGRWIGPRDGSPEWLKRARGWIGILKIDAWGSMVVYTLSTVAFYLLGAAVLNRAGILPEREEMISKLAAMYEPVFGDTGRLVLLVGAFAVLFSTFFVSNATKSRLMTDALHVFKIRKLADGNERTKSIRFFGWLFPILCLGIYLIYPSPLKLVLFSGLMQALLLPLLSIAALYFRFQVRDPELKPSRLWDAFLILSTIAFWIVGIYLVWTKGGQLWAALF
ncbi:Nramp family divalent metal transporter [Verrucomicrobiales bacterium]|nr:Nramp family divalent metal transporter [Verrucomicrobiales bacterium]